MKRSSVPRGRVTLGLMLIVGGLGLSACTCLTKGQGELDVGVQQRGMASWYGEYFHGLTTASGEIYDMHAMTAAHRTLPLGTVVKVLNILNGKQVLVIINDRGPYKKGRIIDLSYGAAEELEMSDRGVSPVYLEVVGVQTPERPSLEALLAVTPPTVTDREWAHEPSRSWMEEPFIPSGLSKETLGTVRFRLPPAHLWRAPRTRRVGDILEAEHSVYVTATGLVIA